MMAANFGYDEQYVDNEMDMERLFAHMHYIRENPPAGTLIKAYFEAQSNGSGRHIKYPSAPKRAYKNEAERMAGEKQQLNSLAAQLHININDLQPKPRRRLRRID